MKCNSGGMFPERKNISPEIEAAIAEGREIGLREAAAYVRGLKETFVPYVTRGLNSAFHDGEDAEGWAKLSSGSQRMLALSARGILRLIDNEPMPEHDHIWAKQSDGTSTCAVCGAEKSSD